MASKTPKTNAVAIIAVVVLIALIALGTFWLLKPKESLPATYNGFPIMQGLCPGSTVQCYYVNFSLRNTPYTISFYKHPKEVENVSVDPSALLALIQMEKVANGTVYIAVPNGAGGQVGVAGIELGRIIGTKNNIMNLNAKAAVYGAGDEQVSCEKVPANSLVISLSQEPLDVVYLRSPQCIVIGAQNIDNIVGVAEAYTYHLLGVIPTEKPSNSTGTP